MKSTVLSVLRSCIRAGPSARWVRLTAATSLGLAAVQAFPPAPPHILYGTVRDETGRPMDAGEAVVVLETAGGVRLRTGLTPGLIPGANYRLAVPMDAGLTPDNYQPTALRPEVSFRLKVVVGETVWLPLEMQGRFDQLGQPAQRTRIDLTLGEDLDGDGLPDAWERALAAMLGGGLDEEDIRPGDDADHDGLSNLEEYLAGTYAFDPEDGFRIELIEAGEAGPSVEFLALRGRTYSVEGSADLHSWSPVAFRLGEEAPSAPARATYRAEDVRRVRAVIAGDLTRLRFFRLMVR